MFVESKSLKFSEFTEIWKKTILQNDLYHQHTKDIAISDFVVSLLKEYK